MPARILLYLIAVFALPYPAWGQIAYWQHYLGGKRVDMGKKLLLRADGTLVMGADTYAADGLGLGNHSEGTDVVVFRYATQGRYFWRTILGGSGNETLADLVPLPDGGYVGIGSSNSPDGDLPRNRGGDDVWVFRLDYMGKLVWSKAYGGRGDDRGLVILPMPEGGFLIGGESASADGDMAPPHHGGLDSWIARLDDDGNLLWGRHYGGSGNEKVSRMHQLTGGHVLVVNSADSRDGDVRQPLGRKDVWVFAIDARGDIQWQQSYGGEDNDDVHASCLTADGSLVLAGTTFSRTGHVPLQRGEGDAWAFCIDARGTLRWSQTYGGSRSEGFSDVTPLADGGYMFCGMTKSPGGDGDIELNKGYFDAWLVKTDSLGQRRWSRTTGALGIDAFESVLELPQGGFLALGYTQQHRDDPPLPGHHGGYDLWLCNFSDLDREGVRPFVTPPILYGTVLDKGTGRPLEASIVLTDNRTLDSLSVATTQPQDGAFILLMPAYGLVSINILAKGYMFYGRDILMDTVIARTSINQDFRLEPLRIGSSLILENIYFEQGKWELLQPSFAELERVIAFLRLNPRVQVQVSGHTDNTGNRNEKIELSLNRAIAVQKYLEKRGIEPYRLRVKGYGMYRPIAPNTTPEGRRRNRRVEFEVINM